MSKRRAAKPGTAGRRATAAAIARAAKPGAAGRRVTALWHIVGLLATVVGLVAGCSLDFTRLPVPGAYLPHHPYRVKVEFSSALNLPGKAKVDSGGVQIGVLDHVQLVNTTAVAHIDIDGNAHLPKNIRAELRQATVLGDIYIAMIPPANPSPGLLRDGDTIPQRNTVPSANIEDLLRSMSDLISGGSLNTLQDTVNNINKSIPPPDVLMQIHTRITGILHDLYANKDTINQILDSVDSITESLQANTGSYSRLITEGPPKLTSLADVAYATADLIIGAGELSRTVGPLANPLAPDITQLLSYITPAIHAASTFDTTIPVIANKLIRLLRERLIPFFRDNRGPKYTVTGVSAPDGSLGVSPGERADEVIKRMRTMGLVP